MQNHLNRELYHLVGVSFAAIINSVNFVRTHASTVMKVVARQLKEQQNRKQENLSILFWTSCWQIHLHVSKAFEKNNYQSLLTQILWSFNPQCLASVFGSLITQRRNAKIFHLQETMTIYFHVPIANKTAESTVMSFQDYSKLWHQNEEQLHFINLQLYIIGCFITCQDYSWIV